MERVEGKVSGRGGEEGIERELMEEEGELHDHSPYTLPCQFVQM